jgi:hypothetical protein
MDKKNIIEINRTIKWLKEKSAFLSSDFYKQSSMIEDFARWNLPNDIASDWDHYEMFCMPIKDVINEKVEKLIIEIGSAFEKVSLGSPYFEEIIWTIEGLEYHPFWENQRKRAKALLAILSCVDEA